MKEMKETLNVIQAQGMREKVGLSYSFWSITARTKISLAPELPPGPLRMAGKFFQQLGNDSTLTFFVLPGLETFDGIIGDDTLKNLKALVVRKNNCLIISPGIKISLLAKRSLDVNPLLDPAHPEEVRITLKALIDEYSHLFDPLSPGWDSHEHFRPNLYKNLLLPS